MQYKVLESTSEVLVLKIMGIITIFYQGRPVASNGCGRFKCFVEHDLDNISLEAIHECIAELNECHD